MISAVKLSVLLSVLSSVESDDNRYAYNREEQACGILQIRQPVISDVNKYCFSTLRAEYVLGDAFDPTLARDIASNYLRLWCNSAQKYSLEDAARIWNGGPEGWWKLSTLPYWRKVEAELKKRGLDSHDTIAAWQPPQTKQSPAAPSAFTLGTTAASSSRSDLATSFTFVLSASAARASPSTSFTFTIKPSASRPAPPPASRPPTSPPVRILVVAPLFELRVR